MDWKPMMTNEERCEELREALKAAQAAIEPPMQGAVDRGPGGVVAAGEIQTEPQTTPGLEEEIKRIEQALRDEGCVPA